MTGTLTMSLKERERLKVIHRIENHELTVALGAAALHMAALRLYFQRYGIPRAFYTDFGAVFYGEDKPTEYQRAMQALGVESIFANSPQAKGRVERSNRTHQDRLVKALRRHRIATIDAANRFLEKSYLQQHNDRFATCDHLADLHRSCEGIDLDNILCFQTTRQVHNDYTIRSTPSMFNCCAAVRRCRRLNAMSWFANGWTALYIFSLRTKNSTTNNSTKNPGVRSRGQRIIIRGDGEPSAPPNAKPIKIWRIFSNSTSY